MDGKNEATAPLKQIKHMIKLHVTNSPQASEEEVHLRMNEIFRSKGGVSMEVTRNLLQEFRPQAEESNIDLMEQFDHEKENRVFFYHNYNRSLPSSKLSEIKAKKAPVIPVKNDLPPVQENKPAKVDEKVPDTPPSKPDPVLEQVPSAESTATVTSASPLSPTESPKPASPVSVAPPTETPEPKPSVETISEPVYPPETSPTATPLSSPAPTAKPTPVLPDPQPEVKPKVFKSAKIDKQLKKEDKDKSICSNCTIS